MDVITESSRDHQGATIIVKCYGILTFSKKFGPFKYPFLDRLHSVVIEFGAPKYESGSGGKYGLLRDDWHGREEDDRGV